jgi:transposase-like protein
MAGRKKKTGEFLREQQAKELARLEGLGVGGEAGSEAEAGGGRQPIALVGSPDGGGGERSEPEPPGGGTTSAAPKPGSTGRPEPEVVPQAKRRRFSAKYKQDILRRADACTEPGELGALLRREGLYSSHLTTWRRQQYDGSLAGLAPKKRGRKPDPDRELRQRNAQLEKENLRLANKLEKAELIIEVQKKVARLLSMDQPDQSEEKK